MKICLIGCGAMGASMAEGLAKEHEVSLFDRTPQKARALAEKIGAASHEDSLPAVEHAEIVIVAVKPKDLHTAAKPFVDHLTQEQIVVSVLGGTPLSALEKAFGDIKVIRAMPNIACALGKGVIGCVDAEPVSAKTKAIIEKGLGPLGWIHWVPEKQIDALTALAGSGPAFAFVILESMIDAGVEMGLSSSLAQSLACEMWEGALALLQNSGKSTSALKWDVSSPGGITIAGLHQMEQDAVRRGIINTLIATHRKSQTG